MLYCAINGSPQSKLAISDRSFSYGDGHFTTAKISGGQVELLSLHLKRLQAANKRLFFTDLDLLPLEKEIISVARTFDSAVLKVVISAGQGGRGYSRQGCHQSNVIISVFEYPNFYPAWAQQGINLGISQQRLGLNPMLSGLKHLNRLEQVLVRHEVDNSDEDDLLICDLNENVIEVSAANIFCFINNHLYSPEITDAGIAGLMREVVLNVYPTTIVKPMSLIEFNQADAMFITNSVMGIVPISSFCGKNLTKEKVKQVQSDVSSLIQAQHLDYSC